MNKIQRLILYVILLTSIKSQIDCKTTIDHLLPPARLRSFVIYPMKELRNMIEKHELELKLRNEAILKEEKMRRKVFQRFFEKHPLSSKSFFSDFQTNRFI
jgi:hypothetical protein